MTRSSSRQTVWTAPIVQRAILDAFVKLDPRVMVANPVMFVVEVGSVLVTLALIRDIIAGAPHLAFQIQITLWLWFTVLFANFAEAAAEGRGKAQAPLAELGEHPEAGGPVCVMKGKYGPYVKWEKLNATIPDTVEPAELTMAQAVQLLDERAAKSGKTAPARKKAAPRATKKKPAGKASAGTRKAGAGKTASAKKD